MSYACPEPQDVGIVISWHMIEQRFRASFRHAMHGGQIREREQLRMSFREGFRAGKLYLRELRRMRGIVSFPLQGKVKIKAV